MHGFTNVDIILHHPVYTEKDYLAEEIRHRKKLKIHDRNTLPRYAMSFAMIAKVTVFAADKRTILV